MSFFYPGRIGRGGDQLGGLDLDTDDPNLAGIDAKREKGRINLLGSSISVLYW